MSTSINSVLKEYLSRDSVKPEVQCHIGNIADVFCTRPPPDPSNKTVALDLAGTETAFETAGEVTALTAADHVTAFIWVKLDSVASVALFSYMDTSGFDGWEVHTNASGEIVIRSNTSPSEDLTATGLGALTADTWHMIGITFARRTFSGSSKRAIYRAFLDDRSELLGSARNEHVVTSTFLKFKIGQQVASGAAALNGTVGWAVVLDQKSENRDFLRLKYRFIDERWEPYFSNMLMYYKFEDGSGTTVADASGNGETLTVTGGTPVWVADPPWSTVYQPIMEYPSPITQSIRATDTKTNVSAVTVEMIDQDLVMTKAITNVSRAMKGRPFDLFLGTMETLENEYEPIFGGEVTDAQLDSTLAAWSISAGDANRFIRRGFKIGKAKLETTIATGAAVNLTALFTDVTGGFHGTGFSDPDVADIPGYIQIDDEIIKYDGISITADIRINFESLTRAQFGTTDVGHTAGATIDEIEIHPDINIIRAAARYLTMELGFNGIRRAGEVFDALDFSVTDTALNTVGIGRIRGLGEGEFDPTDVDDVIDTFYSRVLWTDAIQFFIDEDIDDVRDHAERELLKAGLAFLIVRPDGRLTIRSLQVFDTLTTVATLDDDEAEIVSYSIKDDDLVNVVDINYAWDPKDEEFKETLLARDVTSINLHGESEPWELESKVIDSGSDGDDLVDLISDQLFDRFAVPPTEVVLALPLSRIEIEIGDLVELNHPNLPNLDLGVRGIMGGKWQVLGRKLDVAQNTVELTMQDVTNAFSIVGEGGVVAWGGRMAIAGTANTWKEANPNASGSQNTRMPIAFASAAQVFNWFTESGDATTEIDILKNGALDTTVTLSGADGDDTLTIAVALGDDISLGYNGTGTAPNNGWYAIRFTPSAESVGAIIGFGVSVLGTSASFMIAWGHSRSNVTPGSETFHSRMRMPVAGTMVRVGINNGAVTATTYDIFKNGALSETFSTSVQFNTADLSTAFAINDRISVERNATAQGGTHLATIAIATNVTGNIHGFAGNLESVTPKDHPLFTGNAGSQGINTVDEVTQYRFDKAQTLTRIAYETESGDATSTMDIFKNGALAESITFTGGSGSNPLTTAYLIGDDLALDRTGGTDPDRGNYTIHAS